MMNDWLVDNGYFSGEGTCSAGHVNYTGYRLNASGDITSPSSQKNHAEFDDFSLRFGQGFAIGRYWMITPFAEYGYRRWDRKVNEGETCRNQYGGTGVLLQVSPVERLVWSLSGMVGSTFGADESKEQPSWEGENQINILTDFRLQSRKQTLPARFTLM
ncbi:MAG: hypothetical protein FWD68_12740 [Alphaproteobacteria bacterium]|nr:hypothetical protein [Alphaproteobacteria bacterium]